MRELKFRFWQKATQNYIYCALRKGVSLEFNIEPELEQYTGINDKNGKEIYEGDIIQENLDFNVDSIDGIFKYQVFWNEEMLCWSLEYIGKESIHDDLYECNSTVEVIGNIHENPELLEGEK